MTTFCGPVARDYRGGRSYARKDIGQASLIEVQLNDGKKIFTILGKKRKRSHVACPTIDLNACNDYTTRYRVWVARLALPSDITINKTFTPRIIWLSNIQGSSKIE